MSHLILETRQPEPSKKMVERIPVQEGTKLFTTGVTWEDLRGLF